MSASVVPAGVAEFPMQADIFSSARRRARTSAGDRRESLSSKASVPASAFTPKNPPERDLIQGALNGDSEALEDLFGRYRTRMYRVAVRLLRSKEDAEDAVQDALLSAYRNLAAFQGRSLFSTWLTRIVVNAALIKRRSQRAHPELFLEDAASNRTRPLTIDVVDSRPDPEQILASIESHLVVEDALSKLAPAMRSAFRLRELEDFSNTEAALASGVQMGAFKSRITRARNQLATQVDHSSLVPLQKFIPAANSASRAFTSEDSR